MPVPNTYINGKQSVLDFSLYGIKAFAAGTTVLDYDYMSVSAANGKQYTNIPSPSQTPANWPVFTVKAFGVKLFSEAVIADVISLCQDAWYSFRVADYEYRSGNLMELILPSSFYATNATAVSSFQSDIRQGFWVPLAQPVDIPPQSSVNFEINFLTDVAGFHSKRVGVWLKGVLAKMIAG